MYVCMCLAIEGLGGVKSGMDDDEEADARKKGVAVMYFILAGKRREEKEGKGRVEVIGWGDER